MDMRGRCGALLMGSCLVVCSCVERRTRVNKREASALGMTQGSGGSKSGIRSEALRRNSCGGSGGLHVGHIDAW